MGGTTFLTSNQQQREKTVKIMTKFKFNYIFLGIIGFIMGQAEISGLFPLALVYWSMILGINKYLSIIITLTTGFGLIWSGDYLNLLYLLAGIMGLFFYKIIDGYKSELFDLPFCISLIYLIVSLFMNYFQHHLFYHYFISIGEAIFIYILIEISLEGIDQLINQPKRLDRLAILTILIISSGTLIGLTHFNLIPEIAIDILILTFVIGIAYIVGFTYAIVSAVIYGLVLVSANLISVLVMLRYVIVAVTCGLFQKKEKYWLLAGIGLGFLIYSGLAPTIYDLKTTLIEMIVAGGIVILVPDNIWHKIFAGLTREPIKVSNIDLNSELSGSLTQQLSELAAVFKELSATFKEVEPKVAENDQELDNFIYIFKRKICRHCQRVNICWQHEKKDTYQRMALMIDAGERKGYLDKAIVERFLGGKCVYSKQIAAGAKASFELYRLNQFWKQRLTEKQIIVSEQLDGISEIIQQFSNSSKLTLKKDPSLVEIKEQAEKRGIDIYNIELNPNLHSAQLNFQIEMDPCPGNDACQEQILALLNSKYDTNFRILSRKCGDKLKEKPCKIQYGPVGNFNLDFAAWQYASQDDVSGDSYLYKPLRDGMDLIVLSDGMGIGSKAAKESKAALGLLQSIIDAGFDQSLAIKTINSALYLRSQDESFTTLDIGIFDTFSGKISFSKIGAVTSYIKRGWELIEVESSSLPAGILNKIDVNSRTFQLQHNDFVVMITDGVLEAREEKDWLKQLLKTSSFDQAKDLADYVYEIISAKDLSFKDDMTAVIFKVEGISPKRRKFRV